MKLFNQWIFLKQSKQIFNLKLFKNYKIMNKIQMKILLYQNKIINFKYLKCLSIVILTFKIKFQKVIHLKHLEYLMKKEILLEENQLFQIHQNN